MSEKQTPTYLANLNAHPRDKNIQFDEGPHIYTVNGEQGYTSVTTIIHGLFPKFDTEKIVNASVNSKKMKDPNYKYYGMTKEQILELWEKNRDTSSGAGTQTHYNIECYYNKMDVEDESLEFQYFKKFLADYPELEAYRTEWTVYYEEIRLSGSIDMVFRDTKTGEFLIYDWKRVKEIEYESRYGKYALPEFISDLPDSNFWHYSLQLNTYRKILQDKYDMKIRGLFLIVLHPDNFNKTYERIELPILDDTIEKLWEYRKKQLEDNQTQQESH